MHCCTAAVIVLLPPLLSYCHVPHRDHGPRGDRQKTRLIWLIEERGFEAFTQLVADAMGPGTSFAPAMHAVHAEPWERRDLLGVHKQKQEGLNWVGVSVPAGRLQAADLEVRDCVCSLLPSGSMPHPLTVCVTLCVSQISLNTSGPRRQTHCRPAPHPWLPPPTPTGLCACC